MLVKVHRTGVREMTFSQQIIYECIREYIEENEEPPTIREICVLAELSSPATVHKHLKNLKEKGYIYYEPRKRRGIRVMEE